MDAQYDAMKQVGHAGAMANICNWGDAQDECPGDPSNQYVVDMCLQQMWSEGPPPAGTTIAQCESPQMISTIASTLTDVITACTALPSRTPR